MKVLFDHQIFSLQIYGGISRYFYELMKNFDGDDELKYELSLRYSNNYYLKRLNICSYRPFFEKFPLRGKRRILCFLNQKISKKIISEHNYDIFHPTYYNPYFLDCIEKKPFVLTIHDLNYEIFANDFPKREKTSAYIKMLATKAAKIIAMSENTKKDIVRIYNIDESKIVVIYHAGSNFITTNARNENAKLMFPKKYLLFVGKRERYKNFINFINAVYLLLKNDRNLNVVCAGGGNFNRFEQDFLKSLSLQNRVFQFNVNDEELMILYINARAFVFPSLNEGFGIPILEAFACKCPAIISNASCFPEVANDAAEYFDPLSIESMRRAIANVLTNNDRREELIRKGMERVKEFSWQKTAQRTKEVYQSIV